MPHSPLTALSGPSPCGSQHKGRVVSCAAHVDGLRHAILSRRALAGACFLSLLVVSCNDGTGPDELVGSLAIVPVFESGAAARVPVERLRVVLLREDSVTVAKDTVFDLEAGQDSVDLAVDVVLLSPL